MWEYEILFLETGDTDIIYGYSFIDACARNDIDPDCVECLHYEYVD